MRDLLRSLFKRKQPTKGPCLFTDLHSHLLPGIDDGVDSFEESLELIREFSQLGYTKVITTPHVMQDFYPNKPADILALGEELKSKIKAAQIPIKLEVAAEYYLDDYLLEAIETNAHILTFGSKYLLFETSFINKPIYLEEFIFKCTTRRIIPVMAHPERYAFVHNDPGMLTELKGRGMLLQLNMNSLGAYYSREVQKMARNLIDKRLVDFLGSDCHSMKHMDVMKNVLYDPYYKKGL